MKPVYTLQLETMSAGMRRTPHAPLHPERADDSLFSLQRNAHQSPTQKPSRRTTAT
jgi:hypothetical protein